MEEWLQEWYDRWFAGGLSEDEFPLEELPLVHKTDWLVTRAWRVSACDNRPGLKKLYVTILDDKGEPLRGVKVRFDTEPSEGMAYDHPNVWGMTDENGYLDWDHYGFPTRYRLWMEDDETPLVENIRTDLGYEYCRAAGQILGGWRPVNRPGVYSYRIEAQRKPTDT